MVCCLSACLKPTKHAGGGDAPLCLFLMVMVMMVMMVMMVALMLRCPESSAKSDLLAYLQRIILYCHQLSITSKVSEGYV